MNVRFEQVSTLPWDISTAYEKGTKVAYDSENNVYGFMDGETFHAFGNEVIE